MSGTRAQLLPGSRRCGGSQAGGESKKRPGIPAKRPSLQAKLLNGVHTVWSVGLAVARALFVSVLPLRNEKRARGWSAPDPACLWCISGALSFGLLSVSSVVKLLSALLPLVNEYTLRFLPPTPSSLSSFHPPRFYIFTVLSYRISPVAANRLLCSSSHPQVLQRE